MFKVKLNLLQKYDEEVKLQHIQTNPQQQYILKVLEECYLRPNTFRFPWQTHLMRKKNVYIYGSVGSGKTFVMDLFYHAIPSEKKARFHFHVFMEQIAADLRQYQGFKDPMKKIVKDLQANYKVICLDEMMVQDVVQAMLLLELIPALMEQNVMLVFTSNIEPSQLYLNGLQRDRFMKVIEDINDFSYVLPLASVLDYRSQRIPLPEKTYFFPNIDTEQSAFSDLFQNFAQQMSEQIIWQPKLMIQHRQIPAIAQTKQMVWFEFASIAEIPRCQRDYLELVEEFKWVFISKVPVFKDDDTSSVILWMYLVDVLYDAQVKLLICADVDVEHLYPQGPFATPFKRSISRMKEMQSEWYWSF